MMHPDFYEPENKVEKHFTDEAARLGFQTYKFKSPSKSGVPDQILIAKGHTMFVELKATGEKPRKLQKIRINEIRKNGGTVLVIDSTAAIDELYQRILKSPKRKTTLDLQDLSVF